MTGTTPTSGRGAGALALVSAVSFATSGLLAYRVWCLLPGGAFGAAALPVDRLVELSVLAVGALAGAWLALTSLVGLACVASSRIGRHWRAGWSVLDRLAPGVVRRLARSAVGIGVGAGLALAPTAALAADSDTPAQAPPSVTATLDLGWQPTGAYVTEAPDDAATEPVATEPVATEPVATEPVDTEPVEPASPVARTVRTAPAPDDGTVVVLRGDTLWDLAAERLGGAPSDADVLREVIRWYDANRDVIGPDPDVILPGQVLRAPG